MHVLRCEKQWVRQKKKANLYIYIYLYTQTQQKKRYVILSRQFFVLYLMLLCLRLNRVCNGNSIDTIRQRHLYSSV